MPLFREETLSSNSPSNTYRFLRFHSLRALVLLFPTVICFFAVLSCLKEATHREPRISETRLYFISRKGAVSYLEPVIKKVPLEVNIYEYLMEALIKGPPADSGLFPVLPPTTRVIKTRKSSDSLMVDLSREVLTDTHLIGGNDENQLLSLWAIANTMTELKGIVAVEKVRIFVEGRQRGLLGGKRIENFWGSSPVSLDVSRNQDAIGKPALPAWRFVDNKALASQIGWGEVVSGNSQEKKIALTFDAGAGIAAIDVILSTLNEHRITATFFVTGKFAEKYPDVVRSIADSGHEFGNHSYSHLNFIEAGKTRLKHELEKTEEIVMDITGTSTKPYFRFPYGARNEELIEEVNQLGYLSIYWTIDSLDWKSSESPDMIRQRVVSGVSPGAIVLMHCNSSQEREALPLIISDLEARGYKLVTVTEVLQ